MGLTDSVRIVSGSFTSRVPFFPQLLFKPSNSTIDNTEEIIFID